ncbi:lysophosphatidic acid receptor 1 [Orussus abietinus]|uniref:lysophosphatidic acid receptor 1 n=1 Tax=Orussus abietinus TaxID=222816 RepID=UPI0006250541|nr:lysophosphatidic acid receptor 1 [Orussus abietinus]
MDQRREDIIQEREDPSSRSENFSGEEFSPDSHLRHAFHRLHREVLGALSTRGREDLDDFQDIDRFLLESTLHPRNLSNFSERNLSQVDSVREHPQRLYYLYGSPILIFFCVLSVVVNIKILLSVYWIRRPLSPTLHISLSLAGADAFSGVILGTGLVLNSFLPYGLGLRLTGIDCFVLLLEAIRLGSIIVTVAHLTALAINHYLGILRPLHYLSIVTRRNTILAIAILWILPLAFFLSYFSLVENEGFQSQGCENMMFLQHKQFRIMFSSLFFAPFLLMVCIYSHIFCIVRKHQASRLRFSRAGSSRHRNNDNSQQSTPQQMVKNVKAIHTTLYILGSYMVGWMPATIIFALVCNDCLLNFDWMSEKNKFILYSLFNCLIILKTLVNPIIYAARMHEIKVAKRQMHASLCGCFGLNSRTGERMAVGVSSERAPSNRSSLSKTAVCRLTSNVSIRNSKNGSYTCTYTGHESHARGNTIL